MKKLSPIAAAILSLLPLASPQNAPVPSPVKMEVQADPRSIQAGEQIALTITLLSALSKPAVAPRAFKISLQSRLTSSDQPEKLAEAILQPGQGSTLVRVPLNTPGLQYVWVKNPELLPGGVYVAVHSASLPAPLPQPAARRVPAPIPNFASALSTPLVTLRSSPDRTFLANGKDSATVEAFLLDPAAAKADIRLNLFDATGTMNPAPLTILQGQSSGSAQLRASTPGTYAVEFLSSSPQAKLDGDRKLSVHFGAPVTRLSFHVSPPSVSLLEKADLVVQFTDENGTPVATDAPRSVSFRLDAGRGSIMPAQVTVSPGQFEARSTFEPESSGATLISASTPNLLTQQVAVSIVIPLGLLGTAVAGGLVGGYLAALRRRRAKPPLVMTGSVTGFMLYWACIFLGFAPSALAGTLLNPLSAFAFSVIGGWLQTEVLTSIAKLLKGGR